jgi:hypothetical protein
MPSTRQVHASTLNLGKGSCGGLIDSNDQDVLLPRPVTEPEHPPHALQGARGSGFLLI